MQRKKLIDLACILDLQNYVHSLDRWLEMPIHIKTKNQRQGCFDKYLKIVKPMVHTFHTLTTSLDQRQFGFYTNLLHTEQVKLLVDCYETLRKFEVFAKDDSNALETEGKYTYLTPQEISEMLPKPQNQIYRIDLMDSPKNKELPYWGTHLDVQQVSFQSEVIKGKGIAKKSLGFPTANLRVTHTIEQKLNSYPNGVYLVHFSFAEGNSYYGVGCVGTNPHYQNATNQRFVEVYVYHDFGEQLFYGAIVELKLLVLMRFQGKFPTFDCFLNAMHNDIETGKAIANKMHYLLQ